MPHALRLGQVLTCTLARVAISFAVQVNPVAPSHGSQSPLYTRPHPKPTLHFPTRIEKPRLSQKLSRRSHSRVENEPMEAALLRTGSITLPAAILTNSPTLALLRQDSLAGGIFSGDKIAPGSPRFSLHLEMNRRRESAVGGRIRRALSESDVIRPQSGLSGGGSLSFPARVPEEECGSLTLGGADSAGRSGVWLGIGIPLEEPGVCGGQIGAGGDFGGDGCDRSGSNGGYGGGYGDRRRIGDYYREMLKSSPGDCLLLRNYGKYLHEVEGDAARAEEYYGRAILASPGDGDVLSLYGELIWETQRDEDRAKSYFDQAVLASPDDSTVLGSYARFLWESEEEEGDGDDAEEAVKSPAAVAAF